MNKFMCLCRNQAYYILLYIYLFLFIKKIHKDIRMVLSLDLTLMCSYVCCVCWGLFGPEMAQKSANRRMI